MNFRSFKDKTTVGPFESSTGIIGPNGGGKSTILEAISFAMVEDSRMRNFRFKYYDLSSNFETERSTKKNRRSRKKRKKVKVELFLKISKISKIMDEYNFF